MTDQSKAPDIEKEVDAIVEKHLYELLSTTGGVEKTLKLLALDAYKAGMEATRKLYKS